MEIRRDGELLVEAQARHVVIDRDSWQPAPMPDFIRTGLSRFTG
jgi:acyl-CoA thioesterase FadM